MVRKKVKRSFKFGLIDTAGKNVVPCKYDKIGYAVGGIFAVTLGNKQLLIDKTGKESLPLPKYDTLHYMGEGIFCLNDGNGVYTLIDSSAKVLVPAGKYSLMGDFSEGLALFP